MSQTISAGGKEFLLEVHVDTEGFVIPIASKILASGCLETGGNSIPKLTPEQARWLAKELEAAADMQEGIRYET